jgi:hypothetical protein
MEDPILSRERSIGRLEISIRVDLKEEGGAGEEEQQHGLGEVRELERDRDRERQTDRQRGR